MSIICTSDTNSTATLVPVALVPPLVAITQSRIDKAITLIVKLIDSLLESSNTDLQAVQRIEESAATYLLQQMDESERDTYVACHLLSKIAACNVDDNVSLLKCAVLQIAEIWEFYPRFSVDPFSQALPTLLALLRHSEIGLVSDTLSVLIDSTDYNTTERVKLLIEGGIFPILLPLLESNIRVGLVFDLISTCLQNENGAQNAIESGYLAHVLTLLSAPDLSGRHRREIVFSLRYFGMGNKHSEIQAVIDVGLLPIVISEMEVCDCGSGDAKIEAINVCDHVACAGTPQQVAYMVGCGVLEALCDILSVSSRQSVLAAALDVLEHILKSGDEMEGQNPQKNLYVDRIRAFQGDKDIEQHIDHSYRYVRKPAKNIMSTYFQRNNADKEEEASEGSDDSGSFEWYDPTDYVAHYAGEVLGNMFGMW